MSNYISIKSYIEPFYDGYYPDAFEKTKNDSRVLVNELMKQIPDKKNIMDVSLSIINEIIGQIQDIETEKPDIDNIYQHIKDFNKIIHTSNTNCSYILKKYEESKNDNILHKLDSKYIPLHSITTNTLS